SAFCSLSPSHSACGLVPFASGKPTPVSRCNGRSGAAGGCVVRMVGGELFFGLDDHGHLGINTAPQMDRHHMLAERLDGLFEADPATLDGVSERGQSFLDVEIGH